MQRADSLRAKTAVSASVFEQLDDKVELSLHNFTVIPPPGASELPAASVALSEAPESDAAAVPASPQHVILAAAAAEPLPDETVVDAASALQIATNHAIPLASRDAEGDAVVPGSASPEAGDYGVASDGRRHQRTVSARDRKGDEDAVMQALASCQIALTHRVAGDCSADVA